MKKYFLIILPSILFSISTYSQKGDTYPIFVLNDSFAHTQPEGSKIKPKNYQLSFLKGFKLDCSDYNFTLIKKWNEGKDPDAIFIVSKAGNYVVELNTTGQTLIDASTMHSIDNPQKQFIKFEIGDTPILGIGTLKIKDGKAIMQTYWVSLIDVK